jgi:SAM-dependent methyltransferase
MARIALQDDRGYNQVFAAVGSTPLRAERRHAWFAAEAAGAGRVLELGCGLGDAAAYVAAHSEAEVVAVDLSEAFLEEARARHPLPNLRFERCDLFEDGWQRLGAFDLVFGNGILHHLVPRLGEVLARLREMAPEGRLAFIEPNLLNPYCAFIFGTGPGRRWAKLEPQEMAFTPQGLRRALAGAGWRDIRIEMRDFLLPGLSKAMIRPSLAIEPLLEATPLTRWLAQSHFVTAKA